MASFDEGSPFSQVPPVDLKALKKVGRAGCITLLALFGVVLLLSVVGPYTEYLWYRFDALTPQVFSTGYGARGSLFAFAFVANVAILYLNLKMALSLSLVYSDQPVEGRTQIVSSLLGWLQMRGTNLVKIVVPIFSMFAALGLTNEWNTLLLARHPQLFGVKDPAYGIDLSFYVFTLPWLRALSNYAMTLLVVTSLATLGVYVGVMSLASLAKAELSKPFVRTHLSVLFALTIGACALHVFLKTYELGLIPNSQFTGAGYADAQQIITERVLAVILAIVALVTLASARANVKFGPTIAGGIVAGAWYLLGVVAWPAITQRLIVDPDRLNKEGPFAQRAISMTRFAYGLDQIKQKDFAVTPTATPAEVRASSLTLSNVRLWDPEVLRTALQNLEAQRSYYRFSDVDIDRYLIDGKERMVMLSPRDVDINNLDVSAQNWTNERLKYTHGYGVVVTEVNDATSDGRPVALASGIPQVASPQIRVDEPRIYYSDLRDDLSMPVDEYTIVNTKVDELDYTTAKDSASHRWTNKHGVPIGSFLARLAFSIRFGDGNLLVSGNISGDSRLLMRRNVVERASRMMPFLKFDQDPYLTIIGGRLIWILDGYTVSDMVPYSAMVEGDGRLNYIRNSVKVTIDAYSGDTNAYAITPDEPILKAYRSIYPGLIQDSEKIPGDVRAHFRYPEDQLRLQSMMLATYHVENPSSFLQNVDAWDIAFQRGHSGTKEPMRPYYVQMKLPDEPNGGFLQILPFSTRNKPNMSGWLAAHCDGADYGKLTMYRFSEGTLPPGPELMESNFNTDPQVSYINRTYQNEQSEILVGSLQVIPLGSSMLYVESLYLHSRTAGVQAAPRLFRVILAYADRIVVGETYAEAYKKLFDQSPDTGAVSTTGAPTPGPTTPSNNVTAKAALATLKAADEALRKGDFAAYGTLQKKLKAQLEQLALGK